MHDLKQIGEAFAQEISADLTGLVGKSIAISDPRISEGSPDKLLGAKGSIVHTGAASEGEAGGELAFVSSLDAALSLAEAQLEKEPGALKGAAFEGDVQEAHKSVMDLCVGILGRVLDEEAELPGLSLGASSAFDLPFGEGGPLPSASYRLVRFALVIEGGASEKLHLLIPSDLAASWFGPADVATVSEPEGGNLALIESPLPDRDEIEELSESIGRKIIPIDVADIGPELEEELAECAAMIVGWNLGGRAGLDVLEAFLGDERNASLRIALACETPTPAMVAAALRWGAHTFLCKPYDANEIRERLLADAS